MIVCAPPRQQQDGNRLVNNARCYYRIRGGDWRTDVDLRAGDVERAAVEERRLCHAEHGVLGGRIGGRVRARGVRGDRAVVNDAT